MRQLSFVFLGLLSILCLSHWSLRVHSFSIPARRASTTRTRDGIGSRIGSTRMRGTSIVSRRAVDTPETQESDVSTATEEERRVLGSQENLMLPRQYGVNEDVTFPQLNHVMVMVLNKTPSEEALREALDISMDTHPLLRAYCSGTGEPNKRIDLFQMVREGDPDPLTFVAPMKSPFTSKDVLEVVNVAAPSTETDKSDREVLEQSWQEAFVKVVDDDDWCTPSTGPLWRVYWHKFENNNDKDAPCALLIAFNHAISDQGSVNPLLDQLLADIVSLETSSSIPKPAVKQKMPLALEDSVLGLDYRSRENILEGVESGTIRYVFDKAMEGLKNPVIVPDDVKAGGGSPLGALKVIAGKAAGGEIDQERKTTMQFRRLPKDRMQALLAKCRENGVSVTNALSAAVTLAATDFINGGELKGNERNYKILQSLDMRRFGEQLDKCETVACMASSMDLMHGPLKDRSGMALCDEPTKERFQQFWDLAREGKQQTERFIESGGPQHAARVFDFTMTISDLNNLVHVTSQSKDTLGRAYSAGITNVGVYERQQAPWREGDRERELIKMKHGRYEVLDIFAATSHARTGCLYPVTCMTVGGELKCAFHPATPVVSEETASKFADDFMNIVEVVASEKTTSPGPMSKVSANILPIVAAVIGTGAIASHAAAYEQFFASVMQMKENVSDPTDFWAALNFWIFFAVAHPLLSPVLTLSEVLHGSPGPLIADLVPVSFLVGNVLAIAAFVLSSQFRSAVNIAAIAAFFAYVGAGLDGQAGLGDYNLALDDGYQGQVVRGCPAYNDVRQPSMNNFDIEKYQGKWYEHKFHDWTQFKEVYDTTLDIRLTEGGKGWVDDFAVKGPAPDSAPLSWDKSPVASGAHYFLFGRVDDKDPPGVLRESGFGVEFPNYIVDVQKDPETGEYKEAIQFQCLQRGGVRVFEGINFLSRSPTMSEDELNAMHARAEKAGMYLYGASPEEMHTVARRPEGAPDLDNSWQTMWKAIGFDKLLELLTESIEDSDRTL